VTPTLLLQIHVDINYYKAPEPSSIIITAYFLNGPLLRLQQTLFRKIQMADIDSFVPLRDFRAEHLEEKQTLTPHITGNKTQSEVRAMPFCCPSACDCCVFNGNTKNTRVGEIIILAF